eukprot:CAMPEP_0113573360 /NCGR_PEP_ID=MMETSP0015_2-20120614/26576_1 /TAXON_ID=2838 /ORGANISM="Odontella" /LENGTH=147 /DNA_ID=CAMNT_0000476433 /DNA_START=43 /DNA_END=486 /DNA_ORIENTATION=- /assembly_acc=CAM_ASM_000160
MAPLHRLAALVVLAPAASAFAPQSGAGQSARSIAEPSSSTSLAFGIPTFGGPPKDDESGEEEPEKKIDAKGLLQLITAGMGSPFLGDFEGVDEETGKFMFSLEANNLVDEDGVSKQTKAPYFESGWVSEEDMEKERQKKKGGGFKFW